jgi:ssRNA-specific RNase YbeY (16S rRNA maturation enzyme)
MVAPTDFLSFSTKRTELETYDIDGDAVLAA